MKNEKGFYVKFSCSGQDIILAYVAKSQATDNFFNVLQIIKKNINSSYNQFQCCEDNEDLTLFSHILHINYTGNASILAYNFVIIDTKKETISVNNNKAVKVTTCRDFTYKVMKTKVKAVGGIVGLTQFLIDTMEIDTPFNTLFNNALTNIK